MINHQQYLLWEGKMYPIHIYTDYTGVDWGDIE